MILEISGQEMNDNTRLEKDKGIHILPALNEVVERAFYSLIHVEN